MSPYSTEDVRLQNRRPGQLKGLRILVNFVVIYFVRITMVNNYTFISFFIELLINVVPEDASVTSLPWLLQPIVSADTIESYYSFFCRIYPYKNPTSNI